MVDEWDDWLPDAAGGGKAPSGPRVQVASKRAEPAQRAQPAQDDWESAPRTSQSQNQPRLIVRRPERGEPQKKVVEELPQKSLKQKEAEYAAARARIFGTSQSGGSSGGNKGGGGGGRGGRGQQSNNRGRGRANGADSSRRGDVAVDPDYDRSRVVASMPPQSYDDDGQYIQEPFPQSGGYAMSRGTGRMQAPNGRQNNRGPVNPAGYDDPDYDRDLRRFQPRLAPEEAPQATRYEPPSYEDSFPALGSTKR